MNSKVPTLKRVDYTTMNKEHFIPDDEDTLEQRIERLEIIMATLSKGLERQWTASTLNQQYTVGLGQLKAKHLKEREAIASAEKERKSVANKEKGRNGK